MRSFIAFVVALACGATSMAADLNKIERGIAHEPKYHGQPKYCLLVFGPQAQTRVWLVLDGKALYADRSGKGDLAGPGKRLKNAGLKDSKMARYYTGPIIAADGKTRYPDVKVFVFERGGGNRR